MDTRDLIRALRHAGAWPVPPRAEVGILQTHISVLFFVDDHVYKVKKPVTLDFLDYEALEQRRHFCEEEVRLNRRLAPDTYLGVVPITRDGMGVIRVSGAGEAIEYAVEMVRLPGDRMMDTLLARGAIDNASLERIVDTLAGFHRVAATGPGVDERGRPEEIAAQMAESIDGLAPFVGDTITVTVRDHLHAAARRWIAEHAELLAERVRDGRIREGHGDLHAGNICLLPDTAVIYDCIEFSKRLRCRDVACDLAFLAMDIDARSERSLARDLLQRYAEVTADPGLPEVAGFYKPHLAVVRGKVGCLRAADPGIDAELRALARREAMGYFHLAAAYTLPPALILFCGLPASGKSRAAGALARPLGTTVLRSDVVRKELARAAAPGTDIYTPAFTQRTYATLLERARDRLGRGHPVIVDATFSTADRRRSFLDAADALGVHGVVVEMTCPEDVVRERMQARAHDPDEVSDADWDVYQRAKQRFEPPDEVPATRRLRLDSRHPAEANVAAVIDTLIELCGPSG